jgi:hypothetical protein
VIALLAALILWESAASIRIENQRYAMLVDLCREVKNLALPADSHCLTTVQTRTYWVRHLFYALTGYSPRITQ